MQINQIKKKKIFILSKYNRRIIIIRIEVIIQKE